MTRCKKCEIQKEDTSIISQFEEGEKQYSFPKHGIVIVAKSMEEATEKLEEIIKKQEEK